ncbi:MAG TPA: hypothetical protein VKX17_21465 [Planctomycetota bacterium]|nr:hypothetical protein [Planctomycetota bacterium]
MERNTTARAVKTQKNDSRINVPCTNIFGMSGISFMVDSRGRKTAAVIDLRRNRQLWEDFYDTWLANSREHEPRESLESVKQRLKLKKANGCSKQKDQCVDSN